MFSCYFHISANTTYFLMVFFDICSVKWGLSHGICGDILLHKLGKSHPPIFIYKLFYFGELELGREKGGETRTMDNRARDASASWAQVFFFPSSRVWAESEKSEQNRWGSVKYSATATLVEGGSTLHSPTYSARTFRTPLGLCLDSARTFRNFFWQRFLPIFIIFLAQSERIPSKVRAESEEVLRLRHQIAWTDFF